MSENEYFFASSSTGKRLSFKNYGRVERENLMNQIMPGAVLCCTFLAMQIQKTLYLPLADGLYRLYGNKAALVLRPQPLAIL